MTGEDLLRAGWSRALWIFGPEPHWMDPSGTYVKPESEALAELDGDGE
jgi:hypothetical protein